MRSIYKIMNPENPYFITSTIIDWIKVFNSDESYALLFQNFIYYQIKYEIEIIAYVIMPEHFHMICKSKTLKKAVQSLKSYTAKKIIEKLNTNKNYSVLEELKKRKKIYKIESEFQIWQEGYHPQEMTNSIMLKQKIEYIHNNPVRKGLVSRPENWKYSSAGYYLTGQQSELIITRYV
ncbi:MAG: transposase [Ignavibacteria bacterium]|nr:transposase [Ignavibacteria bacterium]